MDQQTTSKIDPLLAAKVASGLEEKEEIVAALARDDINVAIPYIWGAKQQPLHLFWQELAEEHTKLTVDAPIENGKTTQWSIYRPAWKIGKNPHELIAIISAGPKLPRRCLEVISNTIKFNPRYQRVFPNVKLVEDTKDYITVERGITSSKDPSIAAMGIEANILGSRWTYLVSDDLLRFQTVWTEHERQKLWERFSSECLGRLVAFAPHHDIGTPWHNADARHRLRQMEGYFYLRFDAWTGFVHDIRGNVVRRFEGGLWPELVKDPQTGLQFGWPRWRLEERRAMYAREMYNFDRQYRCLALSGSLEIFKHLDIEHAKTLGRGIKMKEWTINDGKVRIASREAPDDCEVVVTGIDLAITKKDTGHDTAFFSGSPMDGKKHVLDLRRGKMEGPEILRTMIDLVRTYPMHRSFRCENNAAQDFILQFAENPDVMRSLGATEEDLQKIRVVPHTTGKNKSDPVVGVRGMALDFEQERWPIPCDSDFIPSQLVSEWIDSMRTFDPLSHTDDMLMAAWLFSEECRTFGFGTSDWDRFGIWIP